MIAAQELALTLAKFGQLPRKKAVATTADGGKEGDLLMGAESWPALGDTKPDGFATKVTSAAVPSPMAVGNHSGPHPPAVPIQVIFLTLVCVRCGRSLLLMIITCSFG